MIQSPMDILTEHPVRKGKSQKEIFRKDVTAYLSRFGYDAKEEAGSFGAVNLVFGDPEKAKYLVTAHYDTPAKMLVPNLLTPNNLFSFVLYQIFVTVLLILPPVLLGFVVSVGSMILYGVIRYPVSAYDMVFVGVVVWYVAYISLFVLALAMLYFGPANKQNANDNTSGVVSLLEIARTLPENQRHKVCFVLFDLEEKGLIGSASYRKKHKEASNHQLVINLDCVGDGDDIRMYLTPKLRKDRKKLTSLYKGCGYFGNKSVLVHEKGFGYNPSDYKHFPYGIGIVALKKGKFGLYLGKIHTSRDTVLEITNINILRAAVTTLVSGDAAQ